jgi:hypothetical protein
MFPIQIGVAIPFGVKEVQVVSSDLRASDFDAVPIDPVNFQPISVV